MKTFIRINHWVYHMEVDLTNTEELIFSRLSSLYTTDGVSNSLLTGSAHQRGYKDGDLTEARFNVTTGFNQLNSTSIVIVDYLNHCLRLVDRYSRSVSTLAGLCETSGNVDGLNTRFYYPRSVIKDPTSDSQILVTDTENHAVRLVNLMTRNTTTLISSGLHLPRGITVDWNGKNLLVMNSNYMIEYNILSKTLLSVTGVTEGGDSDGNLKQARYYEPCELVPLSPDIIIVADRANNKIKVVNRADDSVSSICSGDNTNRDGPAQSCATYDPNSLLVTGRTIYVGGARGIRTLTCELNYSLLSAY